MAELDLINEFISQQINFILFIVIIIAMFAFVGTFRTNAVMGGIGGSSGIKINSVKCRICKSPVATNSTDITQWFCDDCNDARTEVNGVLTGGSWKVEPKPNKSIIRWNEDGSIKDD